MQERLVTLLGSLGFSKIGQYKEDDVWLKLMKPDRIAFSIDSQTNLQFDINYYPRYFDGVGVRKFIIPIKPEYHNQLFPDARRDILLSQQNGFVYSSEANAIKKAYICRSPINSIRVGDLVLFYRSQDSKAVDTIGFVEQTLHTDDIDQVLALVARRTVFTKESLQLRLHGERALVILFRFIEHLKRPVPMRQLTAAGMCGEIQTIRRISEKIYREIIRPELSPWGIPCRNDQFRR